MPRAFEDFTICDPTEETIFGFDFALDLAPVFVTNGVITTPAETITSVTFTCAVAESSEVDDPDAVTRMIDEPSINGTIVDQLGGTFQPGVTYRIMATIVTDQGQTISGWANVMCEAVAS